MSKSRTLTFEDANAAAALMLDNQALPPDLNVRVRHLIDGLCCIVGAKNGLFSPISDFKRGGEAIFEEAVLGGDTNDGVEEGLMEYADAAYSTDPLLMATMDHYQHPIVVARHQYVSDKAWYGHPHVAEFRKQFTKVDDSIYAYAPVGPSKVLALGINRAWGERVFTERDRLLIELVFCRMTPIYRSLFNAASVKEQLPDKRLTPRQRETLHLLITGKTEKEIAERMGLSFHTVHDYVKIIYRVYEVGSRTELISRWYSAGQS